MPRLVTYFNGGLYFTRECSRTPKSKESNTLELLCSMNGEKMWDKLECIFAGGSTSIRRGVDKITKAVVYMLVVCCC